MTYNDQIVIQQLTEVRDDYGSVDASTWAAYKTVWAEIKDMTGSEDFQSDQRVYQDSKEFKIHTHDAPDVTTKMQISYDSRTFIITSLNNEGRLRTVIVGIAYDDD